MRAALWNRAQQRQKPGAASSRTIRNLICLSSIALLADLNVSACHEPGTTSGKPIAGALAGAGSTLSAGAQSAASPRAILPTTSPPIAAFAAGTPAGRSDIRAPIMPVRASESLSSSSLPNTTLVTATTEAATVGLSASYHL